MRKVTIIGSTEIHLYLYDWRGNSRGIYDQIIADMGGYGFN